MCQEEYYKEPHKWDQQWQAKKEATLSRGTQHLGNGGQGAFYAWMVSVFFCDFSFLLLLLIYSYLCFYIFGSILLCHEVVGWVPMEDEYWLAYEKGADKLFKMLEQESIKIKSAKVIER